jgi:hypothetical protein
MTHATCRRCGARRKLSKLEVAPYMNPSHPNRWRCADRDACDKSVAKRP